MKKINILLLLSCMTGLAQIQTPQPSPFSKIEQTVGLTQIVIEYSRPAMRGRTIMGDLVPYGELWRAGANKNSTLEFSDAVTVGGQTLDAGKYALFIRPGESMWEVFFYTETENWGLPENWNTQSIAAVVEAPTQALDQNIESYTIAIDQLNNNGADIQIKWEKTQVTIPLGVPTDQKTMASIESTLKKDPKWRDYYNAAVYYKQSGKDLKQAKEWMEKALAMEEGKYWMYRQQALILAGLNEKNAAIKAAQKSLELATKEGNKDYVRLNEKSIKEWSK
jgi:tetratricopeptide (TPR) repeat protein